MKFIFHAWNHHSDSFPTAGLCMCMTDLVVQDGEELHDAGMLFVWCGCWCFPPRHSLFWDCKENEYLCETVHEISQYYILTHSGAWGDFLYLSVLFMWRNCKDLLHKKMSKKSQGHISPNIKKRKRKEQKDMFHIKKMIPTLIFAALF